MKDKFWSKTTNFRHIYNIPCQDKMNHTQTLVTLLQDAIGLNQARQRNVIISFGFDTCNGLKNTTEDDLKGLFSTIECNNCGLAANQQVQLNLTVKSLLYSVREEFIMK